MKVIFLDIDGVITTPEEPSAWRTPDPRCLPQLFRIVEETGAQIVLSSTWRLHHTTREKVESWGIKFIDCTPRCHLIENDSRQWTTRGQEIQEWMDSWNSFSTEKIESFVILDDDSDMSHLKPFLVQTKWDGGLTKEKADEAINILNGTAKVSTGM